MYSVMTATVLTLTHFKNIAEEQLLVSRCSLTLFHSKQLEYTTKKYITTLTILF